ncbi:DNA-3-methyladenine glycosylase I [Candidatus Kaiserbacteria bacterium]|nr:DNA-3-methyladenine glycosylase I [Candidatus Kaiserbacteria bacterium]
MTTPTRCSWAAHASKLDQSYHDTEWGVPVHDDCTLFEFLCLEGAQAGLSWATILKKREHYRKVYHNFDPKKVARFDDKKQTALLADPGIIRNRLKIAGFVKNAKAFLAIQKEFGSFDKYIWQFVDDQPVQNDWAKKGDVPAITPAAEAMSKDLKKRGFTFVGPTICYAFMQATGMVNDHTTDCFRYKEVKKL